MMNLEIPFPLFLWRFSRMKLTSADAVLLCYGSPVYRFHVKRCDHYTYTITIISLLFLIFCLTFFSMHLTQELELFPNYSVTQMLFKEVKNAAELRQSAVEGKINGALINPTMVRYFVISSRNDLLNINYDLGGAFYTITLLLLHTSMTTRFSFSFTASESFPSAGSRQ